MNTYADNEGVIPEDHPLFAPPPGREWRLIISSDAPEGGLAAASEAAIRVQTAGKGLGLSFKGTGVAVFKAV